MIFEANPDYYGEAPRMKKVTVLFMEEDAAYAAALSGQVDLAYTSAAYSDQTMDGFSLFSCETVDNRGFNLPAVPAGETDENGVPIGNDFTSDVRVRRAINLAIDRQAMIDHVLNGHGTIAYSVCDKMPWYSKDSEAAFDPQEAERLLDEAGWKTGADGIREKDGKKAGFTMLYSAGDSVRQALSEDTANQLAAFGIHVTVEGVGWDTAYDRAQSDPFDGDGGAHTPMELYNIYHTRPGGKYANIPYANGQVDAYMDEAWPVRIWRLLMSCGKGPVGRRGRHYPGGGSSWIWLVNIDHLYWVKDGSRWRRQKLHPHGHGWSIVKIMWTSGHGSRPEGAPEREGRAMELENSLGASGLPDCLHGPSGALVSILAFVLLSVSPVDPLQTNVGQAALGAMSPEQVERLKGYWGVDLPPAERYLSWAADVLRGDMGTSLLYRRPVAEVIWEKLSNSLWLPGLFLAAVGPAGLYPGRPGGKKNGEGSVTGW